MHRWLSKILVGIGIVLLVLALGFYLIIRPPISIDENNLPKIIQADFIDLSRITEISYFRSGAGHDYSGWKVTANESCRSMKHYFHPIYDRNDPQVQSYEHGQPALIPTPPTIDIFSPVDGVISDIQEEHTPVGKQIHIRPNSNQAYNIILFHIYPNDGVKSGTVVIAGQKIGVIGAHQGTDIAVEVFTLQGLRIVSYFEVMPDNLFAKYQALGITDRSKIVLTKEYRDQHPLQCNGEMFVYPPGYDQKQDYVTLAK